MINQLLGKKVGWLVGFYGYQPFSIIKCQILFIHTSNMRFINASSSSSSSSCRAARTDIPDPLSPLLPIGHRLWLVFRATSCILTQLLYVCSSWLSCFCLAICGGPQEYITYELVPASPAVSCMFGSSNLDSFRDGGRWPYSWCLVGCCRQDLFNIARKCIVCKFHFKINRNSFDCRQVNGLKNCYSTRIVQLSINHLFLGGARDVMVIVAGIGHGDTSSNPGLNAFHISLIPLGKV